MGHSHSRISESELIIKIADKDRSAFSELYNRFSASVFKWSLRIVRDRDEAEEVVQEVFLQIWKSAKSYNSERGEIATWIINITKSRSIDKLRNTKFKRKNISIGEELLTKKRSGLMTEEKTEDRNIIKNALEKLPAEQKRAIEIVFFGGFTHHEAAEKLQIPVGTIKTRIRLAVSKLRVDLSTYFNDRMISNY